MKWHKISHLIKCKINCSKKKQKKMVSLKVNVILWSHKVSSEYKQITC